MFSTLFTAAAAFLALGTFIIALRILERLKNPPAVALVPLVTRVDILNQEISRLRDSQATETRGQRTELRELLESVRDVIDKRLRYLQEENGKKLDEMRQTVDEKLQSTLEKRLGESFRLVSERLEQVHKGLGEMQTLATGVGDLKKVLSNVKARGTWGEIQLGTLLDQMLTPDQFGRNISVTRTGERVEFAIKLPGGLDGPVWLPIDSKFPQEDYQRLVEAAEACNPAAVENAAKALEVNIRASAKKIHDKYVAPPLTTEFGILFLPTEGLYAEVHRRPGLADSLQRDYRVMIAGPSTLCALLNSLQMGFQTLAIQERSSEVWRLLSDVKTEFDKFSGVLDKIKKKLAEATNTVDEAARRTRVMKTKLRTVESGEPCLLDDEELDDMDYPRVLTAGRQ